MSVKRILVLFLVILLTGLPQLNLFAQNHAFESYLYSPGQDLPVGACPAVRGGYIIGFYNHSLAKLDENGQLAWAKDIQGLSPVSFSYNNMTASADSGYLFTGSATIFSQAVLLVTKTDSIGNVLWNNYVDSATITTTADILSTHDGGALVAYTEYHSTDRTLMLARFSGTGNLLWHKRYIISPTKTVAYAVTESLDGGYAIAGKYDNTGFVLKTDSLGNQQWLQTTSVPITVSNNMTDIARAGSGYAFLMYTPDIYFIDAAGTAIIDKHYTAVNGTVHFSRIGSTSDGGLLVSGYWNDSNHSNCPMLMKTDSTGNIQWSQIYARNSCYPQEQFETTDHGYFVASEIYYTPSTYKSYAIKTDSAGNSWCNNIPVALADSVISFTMSPASCVISNGPPNVISIPSISDIRALSDSLKCTIVTGVNGQNNESGLSIYPNPTNGNFTVSAMKGVTISVYDLLGNLVATEVAQADLTPIDLSAFANGLYAVVISDGKHYSVAKLVKE